MEDPSDGVPPNLLPHIHLVSTYQWATTSRLSIETTVEHLLQAPKIVAEVSAMTWRYLDAPRDGTELLVWQPEAKLGHRFASDGYIWADMEALFKQDYRGYSLEMYIHKSGYKPDEVVSTHCRRRYRLTPTANADPNLPPCDPSLWVVHYSQAERQDHYPVDRLHLNSEQQAIVAQRRYLQQQGQLIRKDFMLKDRNNWPRINAPQAHMPHYIQQVPGYPGNVMQEMHMNRAAHPAHMSNSHPSAMYQGIGPSPTKRVRAAPSNPRPGSNNSYAASVAGLDPEIQGEDDYDLGDYLDLITPRDISTARYKQHHEWMSEILDSPYATGQIMPVDLGLGRKGEIESLTRGFFEAPVGPTPRSIDKALPPATSLEEGRAEEFVRRATARVAEIGAEMEKIRRLHAKRMSRLGKGSIVKDAEQHLRSLVVPAETRNQTIPITEFDKTAATLRQQERIDEVAVEVEHAIKRRIEAVHDLQCVQKGGLEEKVASLPKRNDEAPPAPAAGQHDVPAEALETDSLAAFSEFDGKVDWLQGEHDPPSGTADMLEASNRPENNIEMSEPPSNFEPQAHVGDSNDWVMVDRQGDDGNTATLEGGDELGHPNGTAIGEPDLDKLATALPDFTPGVPGISTAGFDGTEFDDTVDFGNLDTAGDALAGYEVNGGGVDNDEHMGLVLEDSAFGDAFHGTEPMGEGDSANI
ncbi:hypothetical protein MMC26_001074 [Xylographa opegraphella]|nr:hypothetical protein [Xylographa opegraphella]